MNSSRLTSNCMSSTSLRYTKSSLFRDYRAWWFLRYKADILLRFFDIFLWRDQCKACLLFISFQSFQIIPNILHFLLIFTSTNMGLRYQYPGSKVYLSCFVIFWPKLVKISNSLTFQELKAAKYSESSWSPTFYAISFIKCK